MEECETRREGEARREGEVRREREMRRRGGSGEGGRRRVSER